MKKVTRAAGLDRHLTVQAGSECRLGWCNLNTYQDRLVARYDWPRLTHEEVEVPREQGLLAQATESTSGMQKSKAWTFSLAALRSLGFYGHEIWQRKAPSFGKVKMRVSLGPWALLVTGAIPEAALRHSDLLGWLTGGTGPPKPPGAGTSLFIQAV